MSVADKYINLKSFGNHRSIKFAAAIFGFSAGFVFMFAGIILSIVKFFSKTSFHGWEVILIAAAFPLLIGGAHCLDLIEKDKRRRK